MNTNRDFFYAGQLVLLFVREILLSRSRFSNRGWSELQEILEQATSPAKRDIQKGHKMSLNVTLHKSHVSVYARSSQTTEHDLWQPKKNEVITSS